MRDSINLLCGLALLPSHLFSNRSDGWAAMTFVLFLFISYHLFQTRKTIKNYNYSIGVKKSLQVSIIGLFINFFFALVISGTIESQNRGYNAEEFVGGILDYLPLAMTNTLVIIPIAVALSFLIPLAMQFFIPIPDMDGSEDILDKDELKL